MPNLIDRTGLPPVVHSLSASAGYLAECTAYAHGTGHAYPLGSCRAITPRLALRWLRDRGRDVAEQLEPPAPAILAAWADDDAEYDAALTAGQLPSAGIRLRDAPSTAAPPPAPPTTLTWTVKRQIIPVCIILSPSNRSAARTTYR